VASNIRAMPENEKPPARRVDVYLYSFSFSGIIKRNFEKREVLNEIFGKHFR